MGLYRGLGTIWVFNLEYLQHLNLGSLLLAPRVSVRSLFLEILSLYFGFYSGVSRSLNSHDVIQFAEPHNGGTNTSLEAW